MPQYLLLPATIPWGEHLDMARCVEATGELDLGTAAVAMAGALHCLQRDLLLENLKEQLPNKQLLSFANEAPKALKMQTILQTQPE